MRLHEFGSFIIKEIVKARDEVKKGKMHSSKFMVETGFGKYELGLLWDEACGKLGTYSIGVQGSITITLPNGKKIKGRIKRCTVTLFLGDFWEKPTLGDVVNLLAYLLHYTKSDLEDIFRHIPNEMGTLNWDLEIAFCDANYDKPEWAKNLETIRTRLC